MTDAVQQILAARKSQHGPFWLHAEFTQLLKGIAYSDAGNYARLSAAQRESIDMILHKIARILAGNPDHIDHWDDIAGYATLVANILREKEHQVIAQSHDAALGVPETSKDSIQAPASRLASPIRSPDDGAGAQ